jgi:hypothetical protein
LVGTPVDALHIGEPVRGLITGTPRPGGIPDGLDNFLPLITVWDNLTLTGTLLFSLDHGDPFPIGIAPDSSEEVRAAWQSLPGQYVTKTALGFNMLLSPADNQTATEPNLGLGSGAAFDDDLDALDTKLYPDFSKDLVFFSIDDRISFVPNLPADMRTGDVFVRFPDGGVAKAVDGVLDLGLAHDGDGPLPIFYRNDDIDAIILVDLDNNPDTNLYREVTYTVPGTEEEETVIIDLGDGILFSIDRSTDLPYQNGGVGPEHFQSSIPTQYVWFSSYGGLLTLRTLVSNDELGLSVGPGVPDDIDALAYGVYTCAIPEPGTIFLLGSAVLALAGFARRRRMKG